VEIYKSEVASFTKNRVVFRSRSNLLKHMIRPYRNFNIHLPLASQQTLVCSMAETALERLQRSSIGLSKEILHCLPKLEIGEVIQNSSKAAFLTSFLLELSKRKLKAVIWTKNIEYELNVVEHLLRKMKLPYLRMEGKTSTSKRTTMITNFMNNPTYLFFIATLRTGSDSITLIASYINIFWSADWNPNASMQAQSRLVRIGQTHSVSSIHLIADTDAEKDCWNYVRLKKRLNDVVLEAITDPTVCAERFTVLSSRVERINDSQVQLWLKLQIYDQVTLVLDGGNDYSLRSTVAKLTHTGSSKLITVTIKILSMVQGSKDFKVHIIQLGYDEQIIEFKVDFSGGGGCIPSQSLQIEDFNVTELECELFVKEVPKSLPNLDHSTVEVQEQKDLEALIDEIEKNLESPVPDIDIKFFHRISDSALEEISNVIAEGQVKKNAASSESDHPFFKVLPCSTNTDLVSRFDFQLTEHPLWLPLNGLYWTMQAIKEISFRAFLASRRLYLPQAFT
jgi:hypothetical protein